jgi:hypothetical protein
MLMEVVIARDEFSGCTTLESLEATLGISHVGDMKEKRRQLGLQRRHWSVYSRDEPRCDIHRYSSVINFEIVLVALLACINKSHCKDFRMISLKIVYKH